MLCNRELPCSIQISSDTDSFSVISVHSIQDDTFWRILGVTKFWKLTFYIMNLNYKPIIIASIILNNYSDQTILKMIFFFIKTWLILICNLHLLWYWFAIINNILSFISIFKFQFAEFQGNINSDIYYIKYTCKLIYISSHQYMYCDNQTRRILKLKTKLAPNKG